ncbi:MAG: type II and III secretion system protein [Treponema sp.]|nr:type II and III secretion system protein [Treponema sp.]
MKKRLLAALCLGLTAGNLASPSFASPSKESPSINIDGFEFLNKEIGEILYTVSMYRGIAIVADDTVSGKMTFRFAGTSFENAFDSFLKANRLYVNKTEDLWTVSRVSIREEDGTIFADAMDCKPSLVAEKLAAFFGATVTYEQLSESPVSLHANYRGQDKSLALKAMLEALIRQCGKEYVCENVFRTENQPSIEFHIKRAASHNEGRMQNAESTRLHIARNNQKQELFDADIQDASAGSCLEELFSNAQKQFLFSCDTSVPIKRIKFQRKSFEDTLSLICSSANLDCTECGGIYYVIPPQEKSSAARDAGKIWKKHQFKYYPCTKANNLIMQRFGQQQAIVLEEENAILYFAKAKLHDSIENFSSSFDTKQNIKRIELRYIKTSDFLAALPPGIEQSQIVKTKSDNEFFFTGSEEQYRQLQENLSLIDVSEKRIRYDLLVMQYQSTDDFSFDSSLSSRRLALGDKHNMSAALGSVLNLNLDVVGAFGLKFASSLQSAINENRAHVFADTTLHGVNGGTINFKNTNTYRYRDNNLDPETGKPIYSGITREIVSGLTIDITGWVSGDGMITSKVAACVSRQGADLSSKTGNPPPTSEKTITTEVLGKSGEPVILSGLLQNEDSLVEERTPLLSKIPVIGWFFKSHKRTKENTELVIYLVPHCEQRETEAKNQKQLEESENEFTKRVLDKFIFSNSEEL